MEVGGGRGRKYLGGASVEALSSWPSPVRGFDGDERERALGRMRPSDREKGRGVRVGRLDPLGQGPGDMGLRGLSFLSNCL